MIFPLNSLAAICFDLSSDWPLLVYVTGNTLGQLRYFWL